MSNSEPEQCHEFRHLDGTKHACHRDDGHGGEHHADSGLRWGRNPDARRTRFGDEPCPDCEPIGAARKAASAAERL